MKIQPIVSSQTLSEVNELSGEHWSIPSFRLRYFVEDHEGVVLIKVNNTPSCIHTKLRIGISMAHGIN